MENCFFPTVEEAANPWLLCTRIVNLALDAAKRLGAVLYSTLEEQMDNKEFALVNRYIFEALPRSTKLRPLVPEFSHYTYVVTTVEKKHSQRIKKFAPQALEIGTFRAEQ